MSKLGLPEIVDPKHRRWKIHSAELRDSAVDNMNAEAWVPPAYTEAQQLARLHEWAHVKYSPTDWIAEVANVCRIARDNGEEVDPGVVLQLLKMAEENRIDAILWRRHEVDVRPAREALDWAGIPVPQTPLEALIWLLQLAWTVGASKRLWKFKWAPPKREPEEDTSEFFDQCWGVLLDHPKADELSRVFVRACRSIYLDRSPENRDKVVAELATFFKPKPLVTPDEKQEEVEEQREQKEREQNKEAAQERAKEEAESGETGNVLEVIGIIEVHNHTRGYRRPTVTIPRKDMPYDRGIVMRFPHRYLADGHVFGRRAISEAGVLIDISGSMQWTDEMLKAMLKLMPAVCVGVYGGFTNPENPPVVRDGKVVTGTIGRICVLAERGRFTTYQRKEPGFWGGNIIDVEALQWLARWPEPRFWLSDGYVGGGQLQGKHPVYSSMYLDSFGKQVDACERLMKRHRILRVPDVETMMNLLKKRAVTLYKSPVNWNVPAHLGSSLGSLPSTKMTPEEKLRKRREFYPDDMREQPIRFQL